MTNFIAETYQNEYPRDWSAASTRVSVTAS